MEKPHWAHGWDVIWKHIEARDRLLIALDFDGTVAPIAATPDEAQIPEDTKILLKKLSLLPSVTLAFVSGRGLVDLKAQVGLSGVIYCGNHGFEIEGPDFVWRSEEARAHRPNLARAISQLCSATAHMRGVMVEDKGITASIHWRLASEEDRQALGPLVAQVIEMNPGLRLTHGKAVWELRPLVFGNKGTAIHQILERSNLRPSDAIFLGDDETDESAFLSLDDAITMRVGISPETAARYRAQHTVDAAGFLLWLFVSLCGKPARENAARHLIAA